MFESKKWNEEDWNQPGYVESKLDSIKLFSFRRPHMRAFHTAWFAFFACFMMWFSIPPLMATLKKPPCADLTSNMCIDCFDRFSVPHERRAGGSGSFVDDGTLASDVVCRRCDPYANGVGKGCGGLGLSNRQVKISNILSVSGTVFVRLFIGPVADKYGVRYSYVSVLLLLSVPGFCAAAMNSYGSLLVVRFLISFVGGSFVLTQIWTTQMFHSNVVGLANAISAGWGNVGGGAALAVIGSVFKSFKDRGYTNEMAWRYSLCWPPAILVCLGIFIFFCSDDCVFGPHAELRKRLESANQQKASLKTSFMQAAKNWRTWVLFFIYAWSFGVELVVHSNISLYFSGGFGMSQADGSLAGSLMGLLNIFARPLGGYFSDTLNKKFGMRGRLWALFLCSACMGLCMLGFASIVPNPANRNQVICMLAFWATFLTMTTGAVYSVVPFVDPKVIGGVAGIIGAGGNAGALIGNFVVVIGERPGFMLLGYLATISAFAVPLLWMPGSGSMLRAEDKAAVKDEDAAHGEGVEGGKRQVDGSSRTEETEATSDVPSAVTLGTHLATIPRPPPHECAPPLPNSAIGLHTLDMGHFVPLNPVMMPPAQTWDSRGMQLQPYGTSYAVVGMHGMA